MGIKNKRHVDRPRNTKNQKQTKETWEEEEREVKDSEREAPSVTERSCVITSRESPSLPSEDWREEEVSSVSPDSSTRRPEVSSRFSWRTSSEMPSPTPSTPEERPSPPWTSSTPSRDREGPSTVSADKRLAVPCSLALVPAERETTTP